MSLRQAVCRRELQNYSNAKNKEAHMDPMVSTAVVSSVVSALTLLSTEVAKGTASAAGKDLWSKVKAVLGLDAHQPDSNVPTAAEALLREKPELARKVLTMLQASDNASVTQLVGHIDAEKVIVAHTITGDIQM